jgi:hemolysin III
MVVWGAVVFGAIYKLLWLNGPKWVMAVLCVLVGWVAAVTAGELYARLGLAFVIWLGVGGLFYTVGAVVYALKRPDPAPEVFGYHEIFHALVLGAAACHYIGFKIYIFDPLTH